MIPFREATSADADALAELLARSPQAGRIVLAQDRSSDPFARRLPYREAVTLVDDDVEVSGTVGIKEVLVDGVVRRAAYIFDVAVDPHRRQRGLGRRVLDALEAWATERHADFAYAHVLGGNAASTGLFAASGYHLLRRLDARLYPVFGDRPAPDADPLTDWDDAAAVLRTATKGYDLVRPVDGERLRALWTSLPGWRGEDVWQTPRSVLGLWDHREISRPVPLRLPPEIRMLGAVEGVVRCVGIPFPPVPELGQPIGTGLLLGGAGVDAELARLLPAAIGRARERGLDTVVFVHDRDVRPPWTKAAFCVGDPIELLAKALDGDAPSGERPVWVDAADL